MGLQEVIVTDVILNALALYVYQGLDMSWESVSLVDVISSNQMSNTNLLVMRCISLLIVFGVVYFMVTDKNPLVLRVPTPKDEMIEVNLLGLARLSPFTCWCWSLQVLYFSITVALGFAHKCKPELLAPGSLIGDQLWIITRVAWSAYEMSFAMSYLVTLAVTFILIPTAKKKGLPYDNFYKLFTLLMHNFNVLFMMLELFFNRMPILISHCILCFYWGYAYAFFSRYWYKLHGYFYYFFIDYHKPYAPLAIILLITVYSTLFVAGHYFDVAVTAKDGGETKLESMVMVGITLFIMKWPPVDKWYIVWDDCKYYFPILFDRKPSKSLFDYSRSKKVEGVVDERLPSSSSLQASIPKEANRSRSKSKSSPKKSAATRSSSRVRK